MHCNALSRKGVLTGECIAGREQKVSFAEALAWVGWAEGGIASSSLEDRLSVGLGWREIWGW